MLQLLTRRLYLRIWLAVIACVVVLMLLVGWAWQVAQSHPANPRFPREVVVKNADGDVVGHALAKRLAPGAGLDFDVTLDNGQRYTLHMPPSARPPGGAPLPPPPVVPPWWLRNPMSFGWLLALVGLGVAIGVYPVVRRLTQRLEALQRGVQRWGDGDLSTRVAIKGDDEVADLSERFNAAAERVQGLLQAQGDLLRSQKSLLANASHELRSPLTRIRMGLELMGPRAPAFAKDEIARNINELDALVDEILLASRLDAKEADLGTVGSVSMAGLVIEEAARVNAEVDLDAAVHEADTVMGVPKLLRRAVRNLLENALRYGAITPVQPASTAEAPDAGDAAEYGSHGVSAQIKRVGPRVQVQVMDLGPGVPVDLRERIFEPFFRLPGASEREGGVGLGLALVKSIAERHGGHVACHDRPDGQRGACFTLDLPAA